MVALAARQFGRVSSAQLRALGWSADAIGVRVRRGWLVAEHRGCYRLAAAPVGGTAGRSAAAVLAVAADATVSHRTGLELHGALAASAGPVHLTLPSRHRARRGIVVHQAVLRADKVKRIDGLRVASVTRCLVDAAACEPAHVIRRAAKEAEFLGKLDAEALRRAAAGRPAAALLRELADSRLGVRGQLREELERRFAELLRSSGLPDAEANCPIRLERPRQEIVLDVVWWPAGLAVELDGRQTHGTSAAFDADRERDRRVAVQYGLRVVRATWKHVVDAPDALVADLVALHQRGVAQRERGAA